MKIGFVIAKYTDWLEELEKFRNKLRDAAQVAEKVGFNSMWLVDHYFDMDNPKEPMLEANNLLGFLAGQTKTIKLGALVNGVIYREPAYLIKAHTTLDVLSNGRTYFGIGAGWYERSPFQHLLKDSNASRKLSK